MTENKFAPGQKVKVRHTDGAGREAILDGYVIKAQFLELPEGKEQCYWVKVGGVNIIFGESLISESP